MTKKILKLRAKQTIRAVSEIGFFRILVLLMIISLASYYLFSELTYKKNTYYIAGFYLIFIFLIHIKRNDTKFLKIYFERHKIIQFSEYFILSIPLIIGLAISNPFIIPLYLATILAIVQTKINIKKSNRNFTIQKKIPSDCFEWKAGIRKNFIPITLLWIIASATSFFTGSVPLAILIFALMQIQFYEKGEDLQILLAPEINEKKFIIKKIKNQILLFSLFILPLILVFLIFHSQLWYIVATEYLITISLQVFFVILKYAFYQPNQKPAGMQIYSSIGSAGIFLPFLLPVVWVLTIYLYFKSLKNLNFYLNDFN